MKTRAVSQTSFRNMRAAVAVFAKPSKRHHAEGEATWRTPAASMTFTVLKSAVDQWFRHRSGRLGAALAFYSIFSMGPLIVTIIAGLLIGAEASRGSLSAEFRSMLGEAGSKAVETMLAGASSEHSGLQAGIVGLSLLLVAALGVVVQLKDAMNTIWNVEDPKEAYASGEGRLVPVGWIAPSGSD